MSKLTKLDLWLLDKLAARRSRRPHQGRHRCEGESTMRRIQELQAARTQAQVQLLQATR